MYMIDVQIITLCVILIAIEPSRQLITEVRNWLHRRKMHELHVKGSHQ